MFVELFKCFKNYLIPIFNSCLLILNMSLYLVFRVPVKFQYSLIGRIYFFKYFHWAQLHIDFYITKSIYVFLFYLFFLFIFILLMKILFTTRSPFASLLNQEIIWVAIYMFTVLYDIILFHVSFENNLLTFYAFTCL